LLQRIIFVARIIHTDEKLLALFLKLVDFFYNKTQGFKKVTLILKKYFNIKVSDDKKFVP
jgi:hypothetical protein